MGRNSLSEGGAWMSADRGVEENVAQSRFELRERDAVIGVLDYERRGDDLVLVHTEIAAERRGDGLGDELVAGALRIARARGDHVVPRCWFVADHVQRHPDASSPAA